jgi:OOP family OmpA-OmpF porin
MNRKASSIMAALVLAAAPAWAQQQGVTRFDTPPSVENLEKALDPPAKADRTTRHVYRTDDAVSVKDAEPESTTPPSPSGEAERPTVVVPPTEADETADKEATAPPPPSLPPAVAFPLQFEFGSAVVSANSQAFIRVIAELLQKRPDLHLSIEGHTDAVGSIQTNMKLSWERALAVFRALVEQYGIDPARLKPVGKGPTEPLPDLSPYDGQNRRVQFRVMG